MTEHGKPVFPANLHEVLPEAPAPEPEAMTGEEPSVELDGRRLPAARFALFSGEARAHLTAIREEHEALRNHSIVTDALIGAVRSLADVSRTVEATTLDGFCLALAEALEELSMRELSTDEQSLMEESIDAVDIMVRGAIELRSPAPAPELASRLARIRSGATGTPEPFAPGADSDGPKDSVGESDANGHAIGARSEQDAAQGGAEIDLDRLKALMQQINGDIRELHEQLLHVSSQSDQALQLIDALEAVLKRRGIV